MSLTPTDREHLNILIQRAARNLTPQERSTLLRLWERNRPPCSPVHRTVQHLTHQHLEPPLPSPSPRGRAIADLTELAVSWPELRDALTARTTTWPPAGRMTDYQRQLTPDEAAAEQYATAAELAERTALAPGEHPAPLSVTVLDTISEIQDELLGLADEIAGAVQRPPFTFKIPSASPHDDIARRLALTELTDRADPRRWRYNLAGRDGATAASWLADRLTDPAGPFKPLTDTQIEWIGAVAAACRRRAEPLLASPTTADGQAVDLPLVCECGGQLSVTNSVDDFRVRCAGCGITWTGTSLLEQLRAT
ncbi:hypothetical protein C7C46_08860 [Streptomyces tateyamensis]|uniref:Uncharacterized protein n=1 Tax=Streptomyces tateyamensis TaxID=565073 RepID=A0A2V4NEW4_9ACTN|nr:hypothetical protein [Streptomyces tateyamensis]PYC83435.1 hypothetical protein C7C46_08860 [Streptomyces tateyamensis]